MTPTRNAPVTLSHRETRTAIVQMIRKVPGFGEVIAANIASDSVNDIVETVCEAFGIEPERIPKPLALLFLALNAEEKIELSLRSESVDYQVVIK